MTPTFETLLALVAGLVTAGVFAFRTFSKRSAEQKLHDLVWFQDVAESSARVVESIAGGTSSTWDDKVAAVLKRVSETFAAQTGKPLEGAKLQMAVLKTEAAVAKVTQGK